MGADDHGLRSTYVNHGCRCVDCRRANTDYMLNRKADWSLHPQDAPHGSSGGYDNWSCRCGDCRYAKAEARRRRSLGPLQRVSA